MLELIIGVILGYVFKDFIGYMVNIVKRGMEIEKVEKGFENKVLEKRSNV